MNPRQAFVTLSLLLAIAPLARSQVTVRVSVDSGGLQGNANTGPTVVSGDGRFVAFASNASNLVAGDTNGVTDVFVHDRLLATTERVSVSTAGLQGNFQSGVSGNSGFLEVLPPGLSISADGRFVVFESNATNLVAGDTNARTDIFLRDRQLGTTERVSLKAGGSQCGSDCFRPSVSDDGRFITFQSGDNSIVVGDITGFDVFVRDRSIPSTFKVSLGNGGIQGNNDSEPFAGPGAISNDGRYVVFRSLCSNFVAGDTNATWDAFVHDRTLLVTTRASVSNAGAQGNSGNGGVDGARMSADGRYVAFASQATNLVPGDVNGFSDVFVRDLVAGTTVCASLDSSGVPAANGVVSVPFISADGRFVAFDSASSVLVSGDANGRRDAFLRDLSTGVIRIASRSSAGVASSQDSYAGSLSSDGRFVAFWSLGSTLVAGDTNARWDAFVHDRGSNSAISYCTAGTSTNGCTATMGAVGTPSASAGAGFTLFASNVEGQKSGLIFYGLDNAGFTPVAWGTGSSFLCVKSPTQRSTATNSGGTANACDGTLALDWNTLATNPTVLGFPFTAGQQVFAQAWYRDPPSPKSTALSNAVEFVVEP
ncbi:MAG: calcium-binding protein [Planctomycetaceae bacterium]|nr:calcium-binding protein [Planctomycetaceae bacterium]